MSDGIVKKEPYHDIFLTVDCRHGLNPFSEIINGHNDVLMTTGRGGITSHEVNFPLTEGTDCDDMM